MDTYIEKAQQTWIKASSNFQWYPIMQAISTIGKPYTTNVDHRKVTTHGSADEGSPKLLKTEKYAHESWAGALVVNCNLNP